MRWLILATVASLAVFLSATTLLYRSLSQRIHVLEEPVTVVVERGDSVTVVAEKLEDSGVLERKNVFTGLSRVTSSSSNIQAGEYAFEGKVSPVSILNQLTLGETVSHSIKLGEGETLDVYLNLLRAEPKLTNDLDEVTVHNIVEKLELDSWESFGEGLFFPDTYHYRRGDLASSILFRAFVLMSSELDDAWEQRSETASVVTKYDLLKVASLIEKESSFTADRPRIGGVIYRRLAKNMYLQIDPTVIYALGEEYDGTLRKSHLNIKHPYNTYKNKGLPPSPICSASRAALLAAAQPADGDDLYFVSRGDGTSQFSATLEEHNRAVAKFVRNR